MEDTNPKIPERSADRNWPRPARLLATWFTIATALILAFAGLTHAFGTLGEAVVFVCKTIPICPAPKYNWITEPPTKISQAISSDAEFKFPRISGIAPAGPALGNQRYDGEIKSECSGAEPVVWELPNERILLGNDPLIQNGWSSSSYVGKPPGPDLEKFDNEAIDQLGWTPGFYHNNMCGFANYCKISAAEVRSHAKEMAFPSDDCKRMGLVEVNNSGADLSVWVRGNARYKVKWSLSTSWSTYK